MSNLQPLWKHQEDIINRAKERNDFALFLEMGTGKTRIMLEILRYKLNTHKRYLRTIVFCPLIVTRNWQNEIAKYTNIPREKVVCLDGTGAKKIQVFNDKAFNPKAPEDADMRIGNIFICNYDALLNAELFATILEWQPEVLILDESHRAARSTAIRTKKLIKISELMSSRKEKYNTLAYRYLLTGTPILKDQLDLFSQFKILDGGKTLGSNFYEYRAKFFHDKNSGMPQQKYFPNWQPRKDMEPILTKLIADKSATVKKEECLDLPPLVKEYVYVEMSSEQVRMYKEMKKNLIAYLESHPNIGKSNAVVANLALTKALRLQQILSGFVVTEDGDTIQFKDPPRLTALMEIIGDLAPIHKIIVWCVFKENYKMIADKLVMKGIDFVQLHGEIDNKDKFKNVDAFNSDPNIRVLIGNPLSGGLGINLVSSDVSIWYSRNFSLEQDIQAESRNYRGGSEIHKKVTRIDMITPDTMDEIILDSVAKKYDISKNILDFKKLLQ